MTPPPFRDDPRIEFRIPISPTPGFLAQVRLFHFALQRLGPRYANARLRIVVGGACDLPAIIAANFWAAEHNIVWNKVPDGLFDVAGIWGTANWRLSIDAGDADVIILSDADTVLLQDIDPILQGFGNINPVVRGHMAHYPPPVIVDDTLEQAGPEFWPAILDRYHTYWPEPWLRYSMDIDRRLPLTPPYFNLGFVVMNRAALSCFGQDIHWTEEWLRKFYPSHMRCQIAITLIAAAHGMNASPLPATYNAANDPMHFSAAGIEPEDVRVLHYLREDEFRRESFLLPDHIDDFLVQDLQTIMGPQLQALVKLWRQTW